MRITTRREFLGALGAGACGLLAAACAAPTPAAPTSAPAAPTPTTGASAATVVAAPTTAPAAPTTAPAVSAPLVPIRITDIQITSAAGSYIAAEKGYFKDEGIEPRFMAVPSAEQVTAIVADSADVAGAAINAQLFNALARGLPIKMMADHGANLKGASAGGLAVRKDLVDSGAYTGAADLKGRKVAVGAQPKTSTADIALTRWLQANAGLTEDDLDTAVIGLPDMLAAFASKNIEASYWQEPFTTIALDQGLIVRGPIAYEMYPEQQIAVLVFGKKLSDNRDLSLRYLRAYTRGVRDYVKGLIDKEPRTRSEVVPILIQHTTVKDPNLFEKAIPSGLKSDPVPNVKSITDDLAWFVQSGQVQQTYDLGPYLDVGLVQQAIEQVGRA
jgi:NitT/TauT family transport system substrate-binding protein